MNRFARIAGANLLGALTAMPAMAEESPQSGFPDTHPLTRNGYMPLARNWRAFGGTLTMKLYTGTSLLPPVAHLSGLTDGLVQMNDLSRWHLHPRTRPRTTSSPRWPSASRTRSPRCSPSTNST